MDIDQEAKLRICDLEGQIEELEEYADDLRGENYALRLLLWRMQNDREYSDPVSSVPSPPLH